MGDLIVLQSLWAMERRHTDGFERSLEENVAMIVEAGFGGVSGACTDRDTVRRLSALARPHGLTIEGQAFPKTIDDLKPVLDIAMEFGIRHIDLQPDIRPRRLEDCFPLLEGWLRLGEEAGIPVYIETHRDRMTTDLYVTLDLLDRYPTLPLLADLSHFLVGREFAWPVSDENHALIHRILDASWAFHGRVASREQVQIEISFPHHRPLVDLFLDWWGYGFQSFRRRAGSRGAPLLHLRTGAAALCHNRPRRQRHHRPLGGIAADEAVGRRPLRPHHDGRAGRRNRLSACPPEEPLRNHRAISVGSERGAALPPRRRSETIWTADRACSHRDAPIQKDLFKEASGRSTA